MRIEKTDEIWFIEKIFSENAIWNSQNSQVYASVSKKSDIPWKRLYTERQVHTGSSVMFSAGVSKFGTSRNLHVQS